MKTTCNESASLHLVQCVPYKRSKYCLQVSVSLRSPTNHLTLFTDNRWVFSTIYIGDTGLRERFSEHLQSTTKSAPRFPVAEHFSSNRHTATNAQVRSIKLCGGNKQRKRQEMHLIFQLGTCQPRGLNSDLHFYRGLRTRRPERLTFQILKIVLWRITNELISTYEGQSLGPTKRNNYARLSPTKIAKYGIPKSPTSTPLSSSTTSTGPVKCKLTVTPNSNDSTRSSILETRNI